MGIVRRLLPTGHATKGTDPQATFSTSKSRPQGQCRSTRKMLLPLDASREPSGPSEASVRTTAVSGVSILSWRERSGNQSMLSELGGVWGLWVGRGAALTCLCCGETWYPSPVIGWFCIFCRRIFCCSGNGALSKGWFESGWVGWAAGCCAGCCGCPV